MKKQNTLWFTSNGHIVGIVYGTNSIGERKAYIGVGQGDDEGRDAEYIAMHGSKISVNDIETVLNYLNNR